MRALIIDDEIPIRKLILRQLLTLGWEAVEASNRREAMELFEVGGFDAALVDVNLGADNGIILANILRTLDPRLNIIVMSGDPTNEEKLDRAGLGPMLPKPFTMDELKQRLA